MKLVLALGLGILLYPLGLAAGLTRPLPLHVASFLAVFPLYLAAVALVLRAGVRDREIGCHSGMVERLSRGLPLPFSPFRRVPGWVPFSPFPLFPPSRGGARSPLPAILALAVAMRAAMLVSSPSLSDDVYRYVWDGKVLANGVNPYRYPPSAPALVHLRGPLWEGINAKDLWTPYPPLAQVVAAAVYRLWPDNLKPFQVAAGLADLGVVAALLMVLRQRGLPLERVVVYAWSPLVLMQFSHSAHNDNWMLLLLVLSIALAGLDRPLVSGLALGLGILAKPFAALAVPPLVARLGPRGLAACGGVAGLGFLAFALDGGNPLVGVLAESGSARFNDSAYFLLAAGLSPLEAAAEDWARLVAASLVGGGLLVLAWQARRGGDVVPAVSTALGLFLLFSSVVEPWYATWLLPFLACTLRPGPGRLPFAWVPATGWLLFSGLVVLTELTYLPGGARFWPAIRFVEYGPLFGCLAVGGWRQFTSFRV